MQSEIEVVEESKDKGETYSCLGKLRNCPPQSNTNEQEVRFANRCVPSIDLSLITKVLSLVCFVCFKIRNTSATRMSYNLFLFLPSTLSGLS